MTLFNDDYILDLCIRMAHHSTAIEGNKLTQAQTASIILNNYIPQAMNEREFYEVRNYKVLMPFLMQCLQDKKPLEQKLICEFHGIVMENLLYNKGQFKKTQNMIVGAEFETTQPYQTPVAIYEWCKNLYFKFDNATNEDEKLKAILESHIHFERIHPFSDGNGRVGRLLMIYSCLEQSILPIVIPIDQKDRYISILQNLDIADFIDLAKDLQENEKERMMSFKKQNVIKRKQR
ncbi:cell filamentation protein Fic [Helicobacter sp. 12S02232-10]|uniref:Fic family protein n=1 Tax=Helicobacter sp. 12S02232-10 TaxID=1476197 RepID=UPI000BA5B150|nr:Fic family protein [Helicobacter sp. 12S02232-10]PAF46610.1 cell filamentation protein Fic [Helicobacter sp. 12S02232-10]